MPIRMNIETTTKNVIGFIVLRKLSDIPINVIN